MSQRLRQQSGSLLLAGLAVLPASTAFGINAASVESSPSLTAGVMADLITEQTTGISIVTGSESYSTSSMKAVGVFFNGNSGAGQLLPSANQDPSDPTAAYSGGIGLDLGLCLTTGLVSDGDPAGGGTVPTGRGIGIHGPNNGLALSGGVNNGEVSRDNATPTDSDFVAAIGGTASNGGDAAVLTYQINMSSPGYITARFVHATDEFPAWTLGQYNDSTAIFVDGENIVLFRGQQNGQVVEGPLTLASIASCGPSFFKNNQLAPAPSAMYPTNHAIMGATEYYNHEFAGFSKVLKKETKVVLAPGVHQVKIVIQDVDDSNVDSALFVPMEGIECFEFLPADFNLDGVVDGADFLLWQSHFGQTPANFTDGDANGDGVVDGADLAIWQSSFGATGGNADFQSDFNRDGVVDGADFLIWQRHAGMVHCASRYEGDADGDGDVDSNDLAIWQLGN